MNFPPIPILNYHKIEPAGDIGITSRTPAKFEKDMQTLHALGYQTVTFKEIYRRTALPSKALIITFDDGYASVYEQALPLMERYAFTGVVFLPAAYIGRSNDWDVQFGGKKFLHLSRMQLSALAGKGFEIASHGMRHKALTATQTDADSEVLLSKQVLQDALGEEVITFCYPFGRFNKTLMEKVKSSGYAFGVASLHYRRLPVELEEFALRRFNIYSPDSQKTIMNKLKMNFNSMLAYRDYLFQLGGRATALYQKQFKRDK